MKGFYYLGIIPHDKLIMYVRIIYINLFTLMEENKQMKKKKKKKGAKFGCVWCIFLPILLYETNSQKQKHICKSKKDFGKIR